MLARIGAGYFRVAGPFLQKLAQGAAQGGIVFQYGELSMQPTPFPLSVAIGHSLSIRGYTIIEITTNPELLKPAKKYVFDRLADGRFAPKVAKTFDFSETVAAYQYLESNRQVGNVVITVP